MATCLCSVCGERFKSVSGFDRHRKDWQCLTTDQMLARGMAKNAKGLWVRELMSTASIDRKARRA